MCSVTGCDRQAHSRTYCTKHYQRWRKHGDPERVEIISSRGGFTRDDRVSQGCVKVASGCWEWQGNTDEDGYGQVFWEGKSYRAHRFSYETYVGPIPDGLVLDHLCRNHGCVNPEHVEPVTQRVNVMRGEGIAQANAVKTRCINGHEFTAENTNITPQGWRDCRTCSREKMRRRKK